MLRTREAFLAPGSGNVTVDLSRLDEKHASEWTRNAKKTHRPYRDAAGAHLTPGTSVGEDDDDGIPPPSSSSLSSSSSPSSSSSSSSSMHTPDVSRTSTFATSFPTTPPSTPPTHAHTLTYLSTRQPSSLDAHSLLRRSCIRTLSCEQLPRTHTGPLFFGDDRSGYTISFVFRLQDSCARGRMRRYAFIAWAGRDERRAARAYKDILHVFAGMASRIVQMAERRETAACGSGSGSGSSDASSILSRDSVPVSSFLSGRSVDPDGHPRRADVRAKGLAELAGKEGIFLDMHAAFVHLLAQLGRNLGGWPMGTIVDSGIRGEVGEMSKTVDGRRHAVKANVADTTTDPDGGDGHARTSIGADVPSHSIAIPKRTSAGSADLHRSSKTHDQAAAAAAAASPHSSSPASSTPTGAKPTRPGLRTSRGKASTSTASVAPTNSSTGTNSSATTTATTVATGKTPSASSTSSSSGKGLTLDGRAPSPLETVPRRQIAV